LNGTRESRDEVGDSGIAGRSLSKDWERRNYERIFHSGQSRGRREQTRGNPSDGRSPNNLILTGAENLTKSGIARNEDGHGLDTGKNKMNRSLKTLRSDLEAESPAETIRCSILSQNTAKRKRWDQRQGKEGDPGATSNFGEKISEVKAEACITEARGNVTYTTACTTVASLGRLGESII